MATVNAGIRVLFSVYFCKDSLTLLSGQVFLWLQASLQERR